MYEFLASNSPVEIVGIDQYAASMLKSLGIYHVRAKQLQQIAQSVVNSGGTAMESDEALRKLPGSWVLQVQFSAVFRFWCASTGDGYQSDYE